MQTTSGLPAINEALDSPSTIRIDASDMEMDGFIDDTFSEYRERSAVRTKPGGSLSFTAPDCGPRYLGFVIFDSLDSEEVEVWIDGVKRGTAVVDGNNQRERLFTLAEPYDFQGGGASSPSHPAIGGGDEWTDACQAGMGGRPRHRGATSKDWRGAVPDRVRGPVRRAAA